MGLGDVNLGGWYYFIYQKGEAKKYGSDDSMQFYIGLAVANYNGNGAVMTKEGTFLKEGLDKVSRYSEGLAAAKQRQLNGYLNKEEGWQFQVNKNLMLVNFKVGLEKLKRVTNMDF